MDPRAPRGIWLTPQAWGRRPENTSQHMGENRYKVKWMAVKVPDRKGLTEFQGRHFKCGGPRGQGWGRGPFGQGPFTTKKIFLSQMLAFRVEFYEYI